MHRFTLSVAVACALAAPSARADDLKALREEIAQLKQSYETRIAALEARLARAEAAAPGPAATAVPPTPVPAPAAPAAANAFNPEMSLILAGTVTRTRLEPDGWRLRGFVPAGEPDEVGPPKRRGFSLGESELVLAANIDPHFRGHLNLALSPEDTVAVEEAWFQTLGLGQGLSLKGGRFLSGIGYQNEQHPHAWDFADAPLAYTGFFGGRLAAEGVQLKWLAPTETFLELGVETGRDDAFPGSGRNKKGSGLGAVFAHVGGDVGISRSWRAGLSLVGTRAVDRAYEAADGGGLPVVNAFTGRSRTAVADVVWKWAPDGNPTQRHLKLQAEVFRRTESGTLAYDDSAGSNAAGAVAGDYRARQTGLYAQGVYQFMPHWRVGYRYDRLDSGSVVIGLVDRGLLAAADFPQLEAWKPTRHTVMADWSPSEFSRLRLQFARDTSRGPGESDHQVWLQYIMSLGTHGAHKF